MKYKIVADSSANIWEKSGVDFASVPLKIVTSQKEYTDVKGLDVAGMVRDLQTYKGKSSTSCPNIHDWIDAFGDADLVLAVAITSQLSGSYGSGMQAKADYEAEYPGAKVLMVDSLSAGPELALIVEKMEEEVAAEKSYEEIEADIAEYTKHSHLLFALEHVDNLARNGRCHPLVAKMAGVLGIRMVGKASDEGTLQPLHKCRGAAKTNATVWEEMLKHGYSGGKVRIAHCLNPEGAKTLKDTIRAKYPTADVQICPTTGLCSYYAELGGLMIGYEG